MKTTLLLLHATSCCWLAGATLSKTDAKKAHKAEVEVSSVHADRSGHLVALIVRLRFD